MRLRPVLLAVVGVLVLMLLMGGWAVLRPASVQRDPLPAPIRITDRVTTQPLPEPVQTAAPPVTDAPAPRPADVVPPPPLPADDADDADDAGVGDDGGGADVDDSDDDD